MTDHCFISYSSADATDFALKLTDELQAGPPPIPAWLDKRELRPGNDWDEQIADAIRACKCLLFVMTNDSTADGSVCTEEWDWALRYKKPVVPLLLHSDAKVPFRLGRRQWIDFSANYEVGLAKLRNHFSWLDSSAGQLQSLKDRLADAERDLRRHPEAEPRIKAELDELTEQIKRQEEIVKNPKAAEEKTEKNIQSGLERERQPEKPVAGKTSTRFINPPPGIAPNYFQDRFVETKQIVDFLNNDSQRLMTIVGRAGVGKTAMVCRLLKALERGELPDDLGEMKVDGIVYLSETGSHRVNFANVFADLSKLLLPSEETAERLEGIYKNPQTSTGDKMRALLDAFPSGRVILLLDNFETLIDPESLSLRDSELSEALNALLGGQHHAVKVVITTRIAPRDLAISEPGRQHTLSLDEGLESPYAENVLREMDADGRVGLKSAPDALLKVAREKTRGYPRALEALYAILSVDRYTTLEELLAEGRISLPEEVVQKLVGEAFNRLDPSAQKVMQALAVYNRPVSPAAIDYLLQPHLPSIDSALVLNRLVNMHFARREAGRYYLHPADKEYALSTLPAGNTGDKLRTGNGLEILSYFVELLNKYPDLIENEKTLQKAIQKERVSILPELIDSIQNLDSSIIKELQNESNLEDKDFQATLNQALQFPQVWTRHALTFRAATYFRQTRKRRAEWKKLEDLNAQLTEFDLRCSVGDYDTAASVLLEIDDNYLGLWGHYNILIRGYEQVAGKINDRDVARKSTGNLGWTLFCIGQIRKAIEYYETALQMAKEAKNRQAEGAWLGNLGLAYADLGESRKAIEYHEQDLVITHEIGDRIGVSVIHENVGEAWLSIGEYQKAEENYEQAIQLADETLNLEVQLGARSGLAESYLFQNDLINAHATIEAALQYDVPLYNHYATALHGIIALRQGERETAQEAFTKSIAQADEILAKTPDYYDALDAKGLALSGLTICDLRLTIGARGREELLAEAMETFRKAREIAPHAGVVKSVLRLFNELVKCDEEGLLKEVREVIEG